MPRGVLIKNRRSNWLYRYVYRSFYRRLHEVYQNCLNLFITDVNSGMKTGKIYIDPIWVFRFVTKECRITDNIPIYRIFKRIREIGLIECLVSMSWKLNPEITTGFW